MSRKFVIKTLGCKTNAIEGQIIIDELEKMGFLQVQDCKDADIFILNSCSVTSHSDSQSSYLLNRAKRENPFIKNILTGCVAQTIDLHKNFDTTNIDLILGNDEKLELRKYIDELFKGCKNKCVGDIFKIKEFNYKIVENPYQTRPSIKIQEGCNNRCSYCIIPYARGNSRSNSVENIISQIELLAKNGTKEIVLTGIHTGNYGVDLGTDFASLLTEIVELKGLKRLRISSIEITELNDRVLEILANYPVVVDHLHIPLQSGSDEILKRMNRKYDTAYYLEKIRKIRSIRPEIAITTDVIVGFPGEDEKHFMETYRFCEAINFAKIHVFPYSIRSKTAAAVMKEQVSGLVKKERVKRLLSLSRRLENSYMEQFLGKTVEVLIERHLDGISYGHTGNYLFVQLEGNYQSGELLPVKILKIVYPCCIASPLTEKEVVKQ